MNTKQLLKLTAFGAAMYVGGCVTNAPDASAEKNETVVVTSPAKASAHDHGDAAHNATVHTHTTRLRVTSAPETIGAGKPVKLTLQIVDNADSTPINEFETVHDEKLHMILTASDLNWFNHVHPRFIGEGKFEIETTFPSAGKYRLYADYKPQGEEGEVALAEVEVKGGATLPAKPALIADKVVDGWIVKSTHSAPEGQAPAANATAYQVALMPMPEKIVAGEDAMMHFQVRDANGKKLEKLQPYLGAMGHSVILATDPNIYLHTHPMESNGSSGSDVMFHTNFPQAGLYKVWGQFQHEGKIITASYVVKVEPGKAASAQAPAEIPANAQKVTVELPAGYKSGAATVKAGTPVALTFKLTEDAGCGNTIAVPAAKWKQTLKVGQSATVVYTPEKSGELKFACSMDMYGGR